MDPLQGLSRTFDPKITHYLPDGLGRDRYIATDNGGFGVRESIESKQRRQMNYSTFRTRQPAPRLAAAAFKYASDGSGRDFYITVDSGGMYPAYVPGGRRDVFKESLRADLKRSYVQPDDFFMRSTQRWVSPRGRKLQSHRRRMLSEVTSRLYSAQNSLSPSPAKARK